MKKFLISISLLMALPCEAQTTRSGMLGYNNSTFTNCGTNCITGPMLQNWNSTLVNSAGFLRDNNSWTGRNIFNNSLQGAINLTPAAPPSAPADGDLWATGTGIFGQIGGISYNLLSGGLSAPSMIVRGGVFAQSNYVDVMGLGSAANYGIGTNNGYICLLGTSCTSAVTYPGLSTSLDSQRVVVGGFPFSDEFGGIGATTTAIAGAITSPAGTVSGPHFFDAGVSGYAQSANSMRDAMGLFGEGGILADGVNAYGLNTQVINCENHSSTNCGYGKGFNMGQLWSIEADASIYKVGSATPTGSVAGVVAVAYAETQPTGQFNAFQVAQNTNIVGSQPWKVGFVTGDGTAGIGMILGASANPPTANLGSQPFYFAWYDASIGQKFISIQADGSGNLNVNANEIITQTSVNTALELANTSGANWYMLSTTTGHFQIYSAGVNYFDLSVSTGLTINTSTSINGKLAGTASTTSAASLNLPQGVAPTSPINGDVWITSAGLYYRFNGTTHGPL